MLTIKIGNKQLVLFLNTKLRFEIHSPLFETDAIPGSYICPFDLPVYGNDVFENAEFIEINRIYKKYNCVVYLDDFPLFSGELLLNTANPKVYRCSVILTGIDSSFAEKKLNTLDYGNDILIGGNVHDPISVTSFAKLCNTAGVFDCRFPVIHAPNFYGNSDDYGISPNNKDYGGEVVLGAGKTGKFINNWNADTQEFEINSSKSDINLADNAFVLVPQFKLVFILRKLFENIGYSVIGDFFSNTFINNLLFLNYFALDGKYKRYFSAATSITRFDNYLSNKANILFSDMSSLGNEDLDNCLSISGGHNYYTAKKSGWHQFDISCKAKIIYTDAPYILFPGGKVKFYVTLSTNLSVFEQCECEIPYFNVWEDCKASISIFLNANDKVFFSFSFEILGSPNAITVGYISKGAKLRCMNVSYQNLNQYSNKLHIANHVTSHTVGSLLNSIKTFFGLAIWFDMDFRKIEISFVKDILLSNNFIEISEFVIKNSLELSIEKAKGYKLVQKNENNIKDISLFEKFGIFLTKSDLTIPDKLNVVAEVAQEGCYYIFKKNETDFSLNWDKYGCIKSEIKKGDSDSDIDIDICVMSNIIMKDRLLPDSNQQGTSEFFEIGVNDTDMQLLIWHGMKPDKNNKLYPFASSLKFDLWGNIISDIDLRLDGESGIFKNFLHSWYEFIDTAEVVRFQIKIQSEKLIELLQLFKPQHNKAAQQIRKIKYNGSLLLPKSISFLIPVTGGYIEAEIEALKEGGVEL